MRKKGLVVVDKDVLWELIADRLYLQSTYKGKNEIDLKKVNSILEEILSRNPQNIKID